MKNSNSSHKVNTIFLSLNFPCAKEGTLAKSLISNTNLQFRDSLAFLYQVTKLKMVSLAKNLIFMSQGWLNSQKLNLSESAFLFTLKFVNQLLPMTVSGLDLKRTLPHTAKDPTSSRRACGGCETCPVNAGKHHTLLLQMFKHEYNKPNKREKYLPNLSRLY